MKINYNQKMEEIINSLDYIPNLLLHSCCAPCSSTCIEKLTNNFNITVLYYNPNIEPYDEYLKRKEEEIRFINEFKNINKLNIIDCDYDNDKYHEVIRGLEEEKEGGSRCYKCYNLRLNATAKIAASLNYDYFATTLTLSPLKDAQVLNKIGYSLENKYNIKYLPSDFKKKDGYKRSIELSKVYNLYRQDYCGCIYSKMERDEKYEQRSINN